MSSNSTTKPMQKPLKGINPGDVIGNFDTLTANSLSIPNLFSPDGILSNLIIQNSDIQSTAIGVSGPSVGVFTSITSLGPYTLIGFEVGSSVVWDPTDGTFTVNGTFIVTGCSFLGNLEICSNFIKATNFNGDVEIIPNGLGSIYLKGGVINVASIGNFYTQLDSGSVTFTAANSISLNSAREGISLASLKAQNYTTLNGDINLQTETGIGSKTVSSSTSTSGGLYSIVTTVPHNLLIGNSISIVSSSGNTLSSDLVVNSIVSSNAFTISTGSLSIPSLASIIKTPSNNINLIAGKSVIIPNKIPLILGSGGNIIGNTGGITLTTTKDITFNATSGNVYFDSKVYIKTDSIEYNSLNSTLEISVGNTCLITGDTLDISTTNTLFKDPIITLANYTQYSGDSTDRGIEYLWYDNTSVHGWFGYKKELNAFTFIPNSTNNSEVISGDIGNAVFNNISVDNVTLNSGGNINVNCGEILNVERITGCHDELIIDSVDKLIVNSSSVYFNESSQLFIGSSGSIITSDTSGNTVIYGTDTLINSNSIKLNSDNVVIPTESSLIFGEGGMSGLTGYSNGNIVLYGANTILSSGNTIINSTLYFGNSTGTISGITNIYGNGILNISATNSIIISSTGSVVIDSGVPFIIGGTNSSINSIITNNTIGDLIIDGNNNNLILSKFKNISLENNASISLGTSGSIISTNGSTSINAGNLNVNSTRVSFNSPIIDFTAQTLDIKNTIGSRGINIGSDKFFGYNNILDGFVYTLNGSLGNAYFNNTSINELSVNNLVFNTRANLNLLCGTISNVNTIIGCSSLNLVCNSGPINLTSQQLNLNASVIDIPQTSMLNIGTTVIQPNTGGDLLINCASNGNVVLNANLIVNGTTSSVYSTVTNFQDPIITLGKITGPIMEDIMDRGLDLQWVEEGIIRDSFLGLQKSTKRLVFIENGTNNSEVFSGDLGNVQFNIGYFNGLELNNGTLGNVSRITSSDVLNISAINGIYLDNNVIFPYNTLLSWENNTSITGTSAGNLLLDADSVYMDKTVLNLIQFTDGSSITTNTSGISITTSKTSFDTNELIMNTGSFISFADTRNSITSDGTSLELNGYGSDGTAGIILNGSTSINGPLNVDSLFTVDGDSSVNGTLSVNNLDFDLNKYILPLGTVQKIQVDSIINSATNGVLTINLSENSNLIPGDTFILKFTNTVPIIDGNYIVSTVNGNVLNFTTNSTLTSIGDYGVLTSKLTVNQNKDVGLQINYWSTTGTTSATTGTINYRNGFVGFKHNTERLVYYHDTLIQDDVISGGTLGDLEINKLFTTQLSGFTLTGNASMGTNIVSGTNFSINGGSINSTPVGDINASTGRFTTMFNTVSATLTSARFPTTIMYTPERLLLSSLNPTANPNTTTSLAFISVSGASFTGTGTMPSTGIADGQIKMLVCNNMGNNCQYKLAFASGTLVCPNPNGGPNPTLITFKRAGQSIELIWNSTDNCWLHLNGGVYVS